jgi:hypothetical protein
MLNIPIKKQKSEVIEIVNSSNLNPVINKKIKI